MDFAPRLLHALQEPKQVINLTILTTILLPHTTGHSLTFTHPSCIPTYHLYSPSVKFLVLFSLAHFSPSFWPLPNDLFLPNTILRLSIFNGKDICLSGTRDDLFMNDAGNSSHSLTSLLFCKAHSHYSHLIMLFSLEMSFLCLSCFGEIFRASSTTDLLSCSRQRLLGSVYVTTLQIGSCHEQASSTHGIPRGTQSETR